MKRECCVGCRGPFPNTCYNCGCRCHWYESLPYDGDLQNFTGVVESNKKDFTSDES